MFFIKRIMVILIYIAVTLVTALLANWLTGFPEKNIWMMVWVVIFGIGFSNLYNYQIFPYFLKKKKD